MILLFIPGIDHTTFEGYVILTFLQLLIMTITIVGMSSCDVFYALMICNVPIMGYLFQDEVNQLNQSLDECTGDHQTWRYKFRNILVMHQEITK